MPRTKAKPYKERVPLRTVIRNEKEWFETDKFVKLKSKWDKKLEKSGFQDIEDTDSPLEFLKVWHDSYFKNRNKVKSFFDVQRYYELATQLIHTYPFRTIKERNVWTMHAEGKSEREIARDCKCTDWVVRKTIKKVRLAIRRDAADILKDLDRMKDEG